MWRDAMPAEQFLLFASPDCRASHPRARWSRHRSAVDAALAAWTWAAAELLEVLNDWSVLHPNHGWQCSGNILITRDDDAWQPQDMFVTNAAKYATTAFVAQQETRRRDSWPRASIVIVNLGWQPPGTPQPLPFGRA